MRDGGGWVCVRIKDGASYGAFGGVSRNGYRYRLRYGLLP